jgi:putative ABC transport system permease protein
MLKNYLRIAFRNIRRNKLYSLVNIGCLATGIAVAMTISLYVLHEHSYDQWHANARHIFSVSTSQSYGTSTFFNDQLSYITGPMAQQADASVEAMVRTRRAFEGLDLQNPARPEAHFRETNRFLYADSNFFRFFSFRLLQGQPAIVLDRPFTVVLTETSAKKYFGNTNPVGKTLLLDQQYRLEVTGVTADPPSNSSIVFDFIASLSTMSRIDKYQPYLEGQQLHAGSFNTWVLLKHAADTAGVQRSLRQLSLTADGKTTKKQEMPYGEQDTHQFWLQPLPDTHLKGIYSAGNLPYLSVFTLVAALILLLALVNYMSLATARAAVRAKEVGVRKVMGAGRSRIAAQFYTESTLYALLSFMAGSLLFLWFRPYFCRLMHLPIDSSFLLNPAVLVFFSVLLVLVILISGSYPALVLSAFRPVAVLYGSMSRQRGGERVRKGFIVLQFTISMALVICSTVIGKQLYYMRHADTGVERENIVMFPFGATMEHYGAYQREVAALPAVHQVGTAFFKMYSGYLLDFLVSVPGKASTPMNGIIVDSSFIPLMGFKWKEKPAEGSNWFDRKHMVLNEAAVNAFIPDGKATGRQIKVEDRQVTIAGVLKDFNFLSLHTKIEPFGLNVSGNVDSEWQKGIEGCLYVKLAAHTNTPTVIDAIKKIYGRFDTHTPFEFQFLDDAFDSNYKLEDQLAALFTVFTLITIVIACLGLFALATFAAQQRLKEIGIRKVLGASVGSIGALLSRDFLRPVLLAVLIAAPLSWWAMNRWLRDFAYRTPIAWWIFPAAGCGILLIALATVLFRSLKAARSNPVDNLRVE